MKLSTTRQEPLALLTTTASVLAVFTFALPSFAQPDEPPAIVITETEREVRANVRADGDSESDVQTTTSGGPFVAGVSEQMGGMYGSNSFAAATQSSQVSSFSIEGAGTAEGGASRGAGEDAKAAATGSSQINVSFTVPVDAPYSLSGSFTATDDFTDGCLTFGNVGFAGIDANDQVFVHSAGYCDEDPPEDASFFFSGTVKAGATLTLGVFADAYFQEDDSIELTGTGSVSFDFVLDFGDRDGDGLLDIWEEEGIDLDGMPPPEIDLPSMGANPDVKDLFVEVDVMAGVTLDLAALFDVEYAFAQAPAADVDNFDGSAGIQLHTVVDGDQPSQVEIAIGPGDSLPSDYYAIKDAFFGSAADRSLPNWPVVREARLKVFRYCLVAGFLRDNAGIFRTGWAEAIPSNDFVVAATTIRNITSPENRTDALAGTFMHELGHTLGLRHGGGIENLPNFKPNYLSVMNYTYQVPWNKTTNQGTNAKEAWRLDYSRSVMRTIDETELIETVALLGPSGRKIFFNTAPEGTSPKLSIGWANAAEIDWDFDMAIDLDPYELDISGISSLQETSFDRLASHRDWNRLWYHLSGNSNFDDRQPWPFASPTQPGLGIDTIEAILDTEWNDQTALGDLIFENGFELGSTTAWSETVP